ncbi:hypothetical protein UB46_39475, partial [Burkholderiaceae bacterium 16]
MNGQVWLFPHAAAGATIRYPEHAVPASAQMHHALCRNPKMETPKMTYRAPLKDMLFVMNE